MAKKKQGSSKVSRNMANVQGGVSVNASKDGKPSEIHGTIEERDLYLGEGSKKT